MDTRSADAANPQDAVEQRAVARHLLRQPLTCAEQDPDVFGLIRRHEATVDRWFTQRLGYRLHLDSDTARLYKTTYLPSARPLRTAGTTERPLRPLEYTMLALALAATAAGPSVISLRDLVAEIRSAAAEAEIALQGDHAERRAVVTALRWMVDHGLAVELYEKVDTYSTDEAADAVLRIRPDRIALVPVPAVVGADDADELLARSERRDATRQWLRARLVEDPVLYRGDCTDAEWGELRRRLGEEVLMLDEMFGLVIEARAEGVAAIDPSGSLSDRRFPAGGTTSHAALLLIARLAERDAAEHESAEGWIAVNDVVRLIEELTESNARRWAGDLVEAPERLTNQVLDLLCDLRLAERRLAERGDEVMRLLPAATRYTLEPAPEPEPSAEDTQAALW